MAEIAGAMERYGFLQGCRQLMKFTAQPRFQSLIIRMVDRVGRYRRRVFRMEVAPPIDVIPQEFNDKFFQQAVVFAVWPEKAGVHGLGA